MDQEVVKLLASSVAGAVVKAMTTDLWESLRCRVARLFGRGDAEREKAVTAHLDEASARLGEAPIEQRSVVANEVAAELRGTVRALLLAHPDLHGELRVLLAGIEPALPSGSEPARISQHAVALRGSRIQQAGGDILSG